jgi:hypothetical protein
MRRECRNEKLLYRCCTKLKRSIRGKPACEKMMKWGIRRHMKTDRSENWYRKDERRVFFARPFVFCVLRVFDFFFFLLFVFGGSGIFFALVDLFMPAKI